MRTRAFRFLRRPHPSPPLRAPCAGSCSGADAERSAPEQAYVAELLRSTPLLARLTETVRAFFSLLNERRVGDLEAWLQQATTSGGAEVAAFAEGMRRDLAAVQAAVTLRHCHGAKDRLKAKSIG